MNRNLPVYSEYRNGRTQRSILVRGIQGDIEVRAVQGRSIRSFGISTDF